MVTLTFSRPRRSLVSAKGVADAHIAALGIFAPVDMVAETLLVENGHAVAGPCPVCNAR